MTVTTVMKLAAILMTAALIAGCADGGNDPILTAVPAAADDDSLAAETEASDPMNPGGGIDDAIGTEM